MRLAGTSPASVGTAQAKAALLLLKGGVPLPPAAPGTPQDNAAVHQFPSQPIHAASRQQGWARGLSSPPSSPVATSPVRAFQSPLVSCWKCPVAQGPPWPCHPPARSPPALPFGGSCISPSCPSVPAPSRSIPALCTGPRWCHHPLWPESTHRVPQDQQGGGSQLG